MIALVISSFILVGITGTYSSISRSITTGKELENAQEVIRYSSQVFTRSLKQTEVTPDDGVANQLTVVQPANVTPCTGEGAPAISFTEVYTFDALTSTLRCRINAGATPNVDIELLSGIDDITYALNGNLMTITVQPSVLPENFAGGAIEIDIALTNLILRAQMP